MPFAHSIALHKSMLCRLLWSEFLDDSCLILFVFFFFWLHFSPFSCILLHASKLDTILSHAEMRAYTNTMHYTMVVLLLILFYFISITYICVCSCFFFLTSFHQEFCSNCFFFLFTFHSVCIFAFDFWFYYISRAIFSIRQYCRFVRIQFFFSVAL